MNKIMRGGWRISYENACRPSFQVAVFSQSRHSPMDELSSLKILSGFIQWAVKLEQETAKSALGFDVVVVLTRNPFVQLRIVTGTILTHRRLRSPVLAFQCRLPTRLASKKMMYHYSGLANKAFFEVLKGL